MAVSVNIGSEIAVCDNSDKRMGLGERERGWIIIVRRGIYIQFRTCVYMCENNKLY